MSVCILQCLLSSSITVIYCIHNHLDEITLLLLQCSVLIIKALIQTVRFSVSGIFTAAFDLQIEWLVVKGIADYADGTESVSENWSPFASVMAASVVAKILNNPVVFQEWPHYKGTSNNDHMKLCLYILEVQS